MITVADVITAILALYPYMSGNNRQCIVDHRQQIETVLVEAQNRFPDMPTEVLAAVGFMETHLGCDQGEGGNWGAPASPTQRHTPGTPMQAAVALWHSYEVCGTWEGATSRFRTGLCRRSATGQRYSHTAMNIVRRLRSRINEAQSNNQNTCQDSTSRCK